MATGSLKWVLCSVARMGEGAEVASSSAGLERGAWLRLD